MEKLEEQTVERTNGREFSFRGQMAAEITNLDRNGLGTILRLYRTEAGSFVGQLEKHEVCTNAWTVEFTAIGSSDPEEIYAFFGHDAAAKALYSLATPHIQMPVERIA